MNDFCLNTIVSKVLLIAQADGVGQGAAQGPPVNPLVQMAPMLVMFAILFYFIMIRPQQREQKERQQRLDALKKNDKVVSIGGIVGTIVDFSGDGKRVTLKVDDTTRIKFTRSSIQGLYDESEGDSNDKK